MLFNSAKDASFYLSCQYLAKPELQEILNKNNYQTIDLENIEEIFNLYYKKNFSGFTSINLKDNNINKISYTQNSLRLLRNHIICNLIERQFQNLCDYFEVVETMSLLADFCINKLILLNNEQLSTLYNPPLDKDGNILALIIMGMGKLGGLELNVSSDIDLVFLFEEDGETSNANGKISISYSEYFEKLGQRIIQGLNKINEFGFVFRVDMRLRPYGDIGSIVCNISMFEEYLLTQGRAWERFAWLKARQIYPKKENLNLSKLIQTFVYRRYLDYTLLDSLKNVHQKIVNEQNKKNNVLNIKLGIGGIREIEFLTQVQQLIYGGQKPILQNKKTLEALSILIDLNMMNINIAQNLSNIYIQYRNIEHAIQYLRDEHQHNLPSEENNEDWNKILAFLPEFNSVLSLKEWINSSREFVHNIFQSIFYKKENKNILFDFENLQPDSKLHQWLIENNFPIPAKITAHIHSLLNGSRYRVLSDSTQSNFKQALYLGLMSCANLENKEICFMRYIDFLNIISQRKSYLNLIIQYSFVIDRLINILDHSIWLSQYVITHPQIIDELLRSVSTITFDWEQYSKDLAFKLNYYSNNIEQQLDILRQSYHGEVFRILLYELSGQSDVLYTADLLSQLVDCTLEETINAIWNSLEVNEPIPYFSIIAYGKLGGKELGYESDLDLVFLYDAQNSKLLDATTTYSYLARKLLTWLTSNTPAGKVFEIDTRLRPNGQSGLLVSSIQAFEEYQKQRANNSAWTWEHQALTRGRFCAGNKEIGKKFEQIRKDILSSDRDKSVLKQQIINMRNKISQEKKYNSDAFNLKYSIGGMIDLEFCVQYLILAYSNNFPDLLANLGNIKLINIAAESNLIEKEIADDAVKAYKKYRKTQYELRLDNKKITLKKEGFEDCINSIVKLWHNIIENNNI